MRFPDCFLVVACAGPLVFQASPSSARECPSPLGRYARGWSEAVAANGSDFVFGNGSALVIRRVDGTMAEIEIGAMVAGLDVVDDHVYVIGEGGLRIVDLLAPGGPAVIGRCVMPGVAESVEVLDGLAYVSGGEWGMRIVDVSVPTNPVEIGLWDRAEWAADAAVDVVGGRPVAVIADYYFGLIVVDAAEPEALEAVAYVDVGVDGYAYDRGGAVEAFDSHALAINTRGNLLSAIDISAPSDPELVGALELDNGVNQTSSLAVDGGYAYVAGKNFFVIDVSDPSELIQISETDIPGPGYDIAASEGQVAVAAGDRIRFIDASDPQNPVEGEPFWVGDYRFQGSGITATDRHVIGFLKPAKTVTNGDPPPFTPGMRIFDVDDSRHPVIVGEFLQDHLIGDAEARGTLVFAVTYDGFFRVIDLADVSEPQELGAVSLPSTWLSDLRFMDLDVDGHLAVVVGNQGLVVIDLADPTNPTLSGELLHGFSHVELDGDSAFVTVFDEIRLVDVADPSAPFLVDDDRHRLEMYGEVSDFEVAEGYAYVVVEPNGGSFLIVVDVEASTGWAEVGFELPWGDGGSSQDGMVSLVGNRLVVALGYSGSSYVRHVRNRGMLTVFDISDPGEPVEIVHTVIPGERDAVMLGGGRIYVSDDRGGLGVYSLRRCLYSQMEPPGGTVTSIQ